MPPTTPFWFKQRQCKAEPAGDNMLKLTGPILPEAYIWVSPTGHNTWRAGLRLAPTEADIATAETEDNSLDAAWEAAFELYRIHVIV